MSYRRNLVHQDNGAPTPRWGASTAVRADSRKPSRCSGRRSSAAWLCWQNATRRGGKAAVFMESLRLVIMTLLVFTLVGWLGDDVLRLLARWKFGGFALLAAVLAVLAVTFAGLVVGLVFARTRGQYFAIGTLF